MIDYKGQQADENLLLLDIKLEKMKQVRYIVFTLILLAAGNSVFAQSEKYVGTIYENMAAASFEWADARLAELDALVSLTDAQKAEVEIINMRYAYRIDVLHSNEIDAEAMASHKAALFEYRIEDYSRLLTDEQAVLMHEHIEQLKANNLTY
jgi:hypothetical protein